MMKGREGFMAKDGNDKGLKRRTNLPVRGRGGNTETYNSSRHVQYEE